MARNNSFRVRRVAEIRPPPTFQGRPPKGVFGEPATIEKFERESMGIASKE